MIIFILTLIGVLVIGVLAARLVVAIRDWRQEKADARQARLLPIEIERERHEHELELQRREIAIAEREQSLKERSFEVKAQLALTRLQPSQYGYPVLLPHAPLPQRPIVLPHAFYPPQTKITEEKEAAQLQLMAPGVRQPQQRYLLDQLEENALQVSPGVRTSDGQPIILSIPDAVHFKLIGSSGFGKSCLAAALLDQAVKNNNPDMLQIALLDLEHKTSRLFEASPNVGSFQVGRRTVPMVATDANEVAMHLGLLKKELDRRALLSEYDLQGEPLLLMYVEEMLSLQFEVDELLLAQMLKDLSVLAVRARKYGMFLLAAAQTDYSTPELKTAQKQFRTRMAFAIDTTAARAAGFMSTELIKYSFSHSQKGDGLYVLETPGVASLMLAPVFNVREKVLALDSRSRGFRSVSGAFQDDFTDEVFQGVSRPGKNVKPLEKPDFSFSEKAGKVEKLLENHWGKTAIVEKLWEVKAGGSLAYRQACAEYDLIITQLEEREQA